MASSLRRRGADASTGVVHDHGLAECLAMDAVAKLAFVDVHGADIDAFGVLDVDRDHFCAPFRFLTLLSRMVR